MSLKQLEGQAVAFLDLAESIGRPLRGAERNAFLWILQAFETAVIQASLASLPKAQVEYYAGLIAQLNAVIAPSGMPPLMAHRVDRLATRGAGRAEIAKISQFASIAQFSPSGVSRFMGSFCPNLQRWAEIDELP